MSARNTAQATMGPAGSPLPNLDYWLLLAALLLLGLGLVMVASASLHRISGNPFYFVNRHLIALGDQDFSDGIQHTLGSAGDQNLAGAGIYRFILQKI